MKVIIANDHGAVALKKKLITYMESRGITVVNLGTDNENSVDYPDMARKACSEYLKGGYDFGILLCGTGIGISIAANKIEGIRAALPQNSYAAKMAKEHNNANFLVFGGRIEYSEPPESILDAYLKASYDPESRHGRRVSKLKTIPAAETLRHLVIWKLKTELSAEEKKSAAAEIKKRLEALNGRIPGLISLTVQTLLTDTSSGDLLLDSCFTGKAELDAYQQNPEHLDAAAYVRSVTESRSCADYRF